MQDPVVFLPGLMGDIRVFAPQIADLSRDHAVMCLPVHCGERVEEIATSLLDVMPHRSALVGHGLGAVVALELARRAGHRVSRLALMGAHSLAETPHEAGLRDQRLMRVRAGRLVEAVGEDFPPEAFAEGPHRAAILSLVAEMAEDLGPAVYERQSRALQRRRDQQALLRQWCGPLLLIAGAQDPLVLRKRLETMAEMAPDARLEVLDAASHWPMLEAAEAVTGLLRDWLSEPVSLRAVR